MNETSFYSISNYEIAVDPQPRQPLEPFKSRKTFHQNVFVRCQYVSSVESPNPVRPTVVRYFNYPPLSQCQLAFIVAPKESIVGHSSFESLPCHPTLLLHYLGAMHTYVEAVSGKGILIVWQTF